MNKYVEALNELSYPLDDSSCGGCKCGTSDCQDCKKAQAVFTLQELVEKATPKKVRRALHIANGYKHCCPICSSYVGTISKVGRIDEDDYCPTCGQALDWSEEE